MKKTATDLREEVLAKVKQYYAAQKSQDCFTLGVDTIPFAGRVYDEKEMVSLVESALDFWLTAGRYARQFEQEFADWSGVENCSLVNSGSSANLLALTALTSGKLGEKRLKPGDEVITVAAGFPTTVNPIIQNRLTPVFVDVELGTYNIDIAKLEEAITPETRAIMLAHTLGNPFDLSVVTDLAQEHDLFLIEDCCDAVGSTYDGKLVGTFGDAATISFYPAHHMTMGEGGAVLSDSKELGQIVRSYRDWGRDCFCEPGADNTCGRRFEQQLGQLPFGYDHKYVYSHIGYNLKVLDLQPAVGIEQLKKLPSFIQRRRHNFAKLRQGLEQYEDLLILPQATANSDPSWFALPITVRKGAGIRRADLVSFLEEHKIMTRMLFAGNITRQPAYQDVSYRVAGNLDNTDYIMENTFFIGVYPGITDEMIDFMLNTFEDFFRK